MRMLTEMENEERPGVSSRVCRKLADAEVDPRAIFGEL